MALADLFHVTSHQYGQYCYFQNLKQPSFTHSPIHGYAPVTPFTNENKSNAHKFLYRFHQMSVINQQWTLTHFNNL